MNRRSFFKFVGSLVVSATVPLPKVLPPLKRPKPIFRCATLSKKEWLELDAAVMKAARMRLRAWSDICNPIKS